MGRFEKILINSNGIDKRDSGYYSTPNFISEYLSSELLRLNPFGRKVLDPAVGDEELLKTFFIHGKYIDSFEKIITYVEKNIKKLLAFSSIENVGIVFIITPDINAAPLLGAAG